MVDAFFGDEEIYDDRVIFTHVFLETADMKSIFIILTAHRTIAMNRTVIKIVLISQITWLMIWAIPHPAQAGDYMVQLFKEQYKEKMIPGTGDLKVDHTWEVKTKYGNKVLILVGTDYSLRQWIRSDAEKHKLWVVKIPDEGDKKFKSGISVFIDLQQLHPVEGPGWKCAGCRGGSPSVKRVPSVKRKKK